MDLFKKNNLAITLTANESHFKGFLWDLNPDESLIIFEGEKFPGKGVNVLFEVHTPDGNKIEGTGKLSSLSQPDKEKRSFIANIKYNQLRKEDIEKLNAYFEKIQADSLALSSELSGDD